MAKNKELNYCKLCNEDCIQYLKKIKSNSIDLIFADPPYNLSNKKFLTVKSGKVAKCDKGEWDKIVHTLVQKPSWIMDGNYSRTMDVRIKSADTIIYLDYPTLKCFWRVIIRIFKYHGVVRSEMANGCKEKFDLEFLHFVLTFNNKFRKEIIQKLNLVKDEKKILVFRTDKQADKFLAQISEVK